LRIVDLLAIDSTIRWREFRGAGHSQPFGTNALTLLVFPPDAKSVTIDCGQSGTAAMQQSGKRS